MSSYTSPTTGNVSTDETGSLIAAGKVNGTSVYNREGENLGSVYDVMIDKRSGHVAYAIMSFGGFLGMGQDYHPLPWEVLTFDIDKGGYVVDIDKDKLKAAPTYSESDGRSWEDPAYTRQIDDYYGTSPYGERR